jgi:hypothetical protein
MTDFTRFEASLDLTKAGDTQKERRDALVRWLRETAGMIGCDCYAGESYTGPEGFFSVDGRRVGEGLVR